MSKTVLGVEQGFPALHYGRDCNCVGFSRSATFCQRQRKIPQGLEARVVLALLRWPKRAYSTLS